jgi:hypothetical protein
LAKKARFLWLKLKRWLRKEPQGVIEHLVLVFNFWLLSILWAIVIASIASFFVTSPPNMPNHSAEEKMAWWQWLFAAFYEEVLFRWIPLAPLLLMFKKKHVGLLIFQAVCFSIFFGALHFWRYNGFPLVLQAILPLAIQGVIGFLYSLVFIKCAKKNSYFQFKALAFSTIVHFLYNWTLVNFAR